LIAQEIVKAYNATSEKEGTKSWWKIWWDAAVKYLRSRFKDVLTGAKIAEISNPYKDIANMVLNTEVDSLQKLGDVQDMYKDRPLESYFYQLPVDIKTRVQTLVDKLKAPVALTKTEKGYVNSAGEEVKRVSDSVEQFYLKRFRAKLDPVKFEHIRLKGTVVHKIAQLTMEEIIAGRTPSMVDILARSKKNL